MDTLEWLSRLISFDTTSRNSNLSLITAIQDWLSAQGVVCRLTHSDHEPKANLLATLPAVDGRLEGGVILSGHTDVVPVDGQQWDTPPFTATEKQGRIYGRGACDMKGFVAVMLALVPTLLKTPLAKPIHFAFSYDEEVGCRGVPLLIADLQQCGIKPSLCIVGEPTNMRLIVAHKGIRMLRCRLQGRAAHSSLTPKGCNAIQYAARLIDYIHQLGLNFKQQGPLDYHYDVPYTTISVNMIQGGIARNIIPEICELTFEFRHLPQADPEQIKKDIQAYIQQELLPAMQSEYSQATIVLEQIGSAPSFESSHSPAIDRWTLAKENENKIAKVSYATEAGYFQRAGIPTFICGPGSIEQAHRANEYVSIQQLNECETFLKQVCLIEI